MKMRATYDPAFLICLPDVKANHEKENLCEPSERVKISLKMVA
jgi:hypothetical protein